MNIIKSKRLKNLQFYEEGSVKNSIFLHHTGGLNADSAINWWNQTPEAVGTAYIIERDGTILEVFPPEKWAFHLGIKGDDNQLERTSVGIELVSAGELHELNGGKYFMPLFPHLQPKNLIKPEEVVEIDWRKGKYFHKYTDEQLLALQELLPYLCERFCIKVQKSISKFWEFNPKVYQEKISGIWSHTTVRQDKQDIVPYPEFTQFLLSLFREMKQTQKNWT